MLKRVSLVSFIFSQTRVRSILFLLVSLSVALPARSENHLNESRHLVSGQSDQILRRSIEYPSWQVLPDSILRFIENYEGEDLCAVLEPQEIFIYTARFQAQVSEYIIAKASEVKPDGSLCLSGFPVPISGQWSNNPQELSKLVEATLFCRFNGLFTNQYQLFADCEQAMSDELRAIE